MKWLVAIIILAILLFVGVLGVILLPDVKKSEAGNVNSLNSETLKNETIETKLKEYFKQKEDLRNKYISECEKINGKFKMLNFNSDSQGDMGGVYVKVIQVINSNEMLCQIDYGKICLIRGFKATENIFDGEFKRFLVRRDGFFSYTTTLGARSKVKKYELLQELGETEL